MGMVVVYFVMNPRSSSGYSSSIIHMILSGVRFGNFSRRRFIRVRRMPTCP